MDEQSKTFAKIVMHRDVAGARPKYPSSEVLQQESEQEEDPAVQSR